MNVLSGVKKALHFAFPHILFVSKKSFALFWANVYKETMPQTIDLKSHIRIALAKRLHSRWTFLCLFHPTLDAPYDVTLHQYGQQAFLHTHSQTQDHLIEKWSLALKECGRFESLWLKNHSVVRENKGLIQRDELLWGIDVKEILSTPDEYFFEFTTQDQYLLPLSYRSLLQQVFLSPTSNVSTQRLWVLSDHQGLYSYIAKQKLRHKLKDDIVTFQTPNWAEVCQNLRERKTTHTEIVCDLPSLFKSEKNAKALFHFFYQLNQNLTPQGRLILSVPENTSWALSLWKKACHALKRNFVFRFSRSGEGDMPVSNEQKSPLPQIYEFEEVI